MKLLLTTAAVLAMSASAFAGASYELKAGDGNYDGTKATKNSVGYYSSDATGNGGVVGGNGTAWNGTASTDNTVAPGSRADGVQGLHEAQGIGRDGTPGSGGLGHGHD